MFSQDYEFKKQIIDVHLHDKIKYCYQCNRCTDHCPVAEAVPDRYNPRKLVLFSVLGLKQFVLGQEDNFNIWGCQVCDTCDEVCPQEIHLTDIFATLKNLSAQQGRAPEHYTGQAKAIFTTGKAIPSQPAIERRRQKMGLPPVPAPDVEEIKKILKLTELDKKIKIEEA